MQCHTISSWIVLSPLRGCTRCTYLPKLSKLNKPENEFQSFTRSTLIKTITNGKNWKTGSLWQSRIPVKSLYGKKICTKNFFVYTSKRILAFWEEEGKNAFVENIRYSYFHKLFLKNSKISYGIWPKRIVSLNHSCSGVREKNKTL